MFGNHGLCGLLEEGAHGKSPKCLGGNLGDFGEFCKGLVLNENGYPPDVIERQLAHVEQNKVRAAYHRTEYLPQRHEMMK